jgi:hypothetical protein
MGREVGRPCHAGPRRCSTDARYGSCAAASLSTRRSATRTAGGAAWPGDAFVRFSPGGAPGVQFPSQVCSHAPGGRMSPSATPRLPFGCLSITGHFHRLVAALSLPLRGRDRIVRRLRLPGFSRCVIRPRRSVGRPILPWALVLIQGFGHNIMCISRPPGRGNRQPLRPASRAYPLMGLRRPVGADCRTRSPAQSACPDDIRASPALQRVAWLTPCQPDGVEPSDRLPVRGSAPSAGCSERLLRPPAAGHCPILAHDTGTAMRLLMALSSCRR